MGNIHRMFILIYIEHRNPKTWKTRNWFRYETFIHLFEFKGFSTWGERDTIFLCWLLLHRQLSTQPTHGACSAQSRLASPSSESRLSCSEARTQLTAFSQLPKSSAHTSSVWRHSHPLAAVPIWDFYFDISEWHILSACVGTPALMLHLINPCAKWKVLSLTKLKSKIYKTKSLHNYITLGYLHFHLKDSACMYVFTAAIPRLKSQSALLFFFIAEEKIVGVIPFPRVLVAVKKANSLVQDLNLVCRVHFQWW